MNIIYHHSKDSDCKVGNDGLCVDCGVYHYQKLWTFEHGTDTDGPTYRRAYLQFIRGRVGNTYAVGTTIELTASLDAEPQCGDDDFHCGDICCTECSAADCRRVGISQNEGSL